MRRLCSLSRAIVRGGLGAAVLLGAPAHAALAAGPYPTGSSGFDISYPQCGSPQPRGSFAIIGVTHGRAFSRNDCFAAEYQQAVAAVTAAGVSFYMNLNAAIGTTASNGASGPAGTCRRSDKGCQAYNYGYNAAQDAYSYASSSGQAGVWWLDIETANSWNAQDALNRTTIQGAADFLTGSGRRVGIYSTQAMWTSITGGWSNGWPIWYAGTASCEYARARAFTGGEVWLVQAGSATDNGDIAC